MIGYHLDTNFLIRLFTQDDPIQVGIVRALFRDAAEGDCVLLLSDAVVAETVWVLRARFKMPRSRVAGLLIILVDSPGLQMADKEGVLSALDLYLASNLDAVDCLLAAAARRDGHTLATFDKNLRRVDGVNVHPEP